MLPPATIQKALIALLLMLVTIADARILPSRSKQVKVYSYVLPAGAEEIRDDINHSFACANRSDGFYVDIDNDCQIFHRCQDRARFSFICAERTVFSQMYQTCVHDGQLGYPCEDSVQYYPEGEDYEPSSSGYESAAAPAQPEEAQPDQPAEAAEAPQAPSKSSEMFMPPVEPANDVEAINEVQPVSQDNTLVASEQTVVKVEEAKDEAEQEQQNDASHHQVNADLFDSVEDESDVPSENSAQEVLDDAEPAGAPFVVPTELSGADSISQEETQEVEVLDDSTQQQQEQENQQELEEKVQDAASETLPTSETSNVSQDSEITNAEFPIHENVPATPEMLFTQTVHGEEYAGDALLNAVQSVEELEPIVHDIIVEHADQNELQPQVAEMVQDPLPAKVDAMEEGVNEVLPELDNAPADMEAAPLALVTADAGSSEGAASNGVDALAESAVESDQQVNELSPGSAIDGDVVTADDSSEANVSSVVGDVTNSDEPEQLASAPEVADVKADSTDEEAEESSISYFSFAAVNQPAEDDQQSSVEVVAAEPSKALESPAIVEEMVPLRPNDSVDLPELIVSTEFHLDSATQGPAIRRRKTFLFRADAIRSRQ
ncbi:histone acetyltransferase KAT6A [Anopheles ziemanni]|uniref:histone acetyltransferase KAT6A n=1 Tax=Anopheles coustani TaxID=139045 RepID=UPI0026581126|nr:histone acetyltransferase KAT6A [Anopheles coustani]XP_058177908.1 histone acetyltransferase KAT6A [Anopheles ziemanni]